MMTGMMPVGQMADGTGFGYALRTHSIERQPTSPSAFCLVRFVGCRLGLRGSSPELAMT